MAVSVCSKLTNESKKNVCLLCKSFAIDDQKYGAMYQSEDVIVHHYCVLLSTQMEQNGQDEEGILGFLVSDILKEKKRAAKSFCDYCHLHGATVFCAAGRCKVKFHVPCGVRNNCLNQFFGAFRSYCAKHRPEQKIPPHIVKEAMKAKPNCTICFEDVVAKACPQTLWAPCCSKNAWFHRRCIESLALSAGYFFKCPLCNDKESFQKAMLNMGIYVPQQDASWETAPNAFRELLERHNTCDLPNCKCPKSRRFHAPGTIWEIILCSTCASQGIHIGCGKLKFTTSEWECPECCKTIQKAKASKRLGTVNSSADSSSDESTSISRSPRLIEKNLMKDKRPKHKKLKRKLNADDSPSSSSLQSNGRQSNICVPDESADIIVLSSDDDLIEIIDSPKAVPFITHTATANDDHDSSSDIDILGHFPSLSKRSEEKYSFNEAPTALIQLHNPSGSGSTVVSASSFRSNPNGINSSTHFRRPVQIAGPNPDVIITLNSRSDTSTNLQNPRNSILFCDTKLEDNKVDTQPRTSTSSTDPVLNTCPTDPKQHCHPPQNLNIGPYAYDDFSNSTTECWNPKLSSVESALDGQQPSSFTDLPLTSDEQLLQRYHHLGLKSLQVNIKPLKFLQIGRKRFLTIVPSSKKKKGKKLKSKLQLKVENKSVKIKSFASLSASMKRKLCNDSSDFHPLKKFILDACDSQIEHSVSEAQRASNSSSAFSKKLKSGKQEIILKNKPKKLPKSSISNVKLSATIKNTSPSLKSSSNSKNSERTKSVSETSVKAGCSNDAPTAKRTNVTSNQNSEQLSKSQESGKTNTLERFFQPVKTYPSPTFQTPTNAFDDKKLEVSERSIECHQSQKKMLKLGNEKKKNGRNCASDKTSGGSSCSNLLPSSVVTKPNSPISLQKLKTKKANDIKFDSTEKKSIRIKAHEHSIRTMSDIKTTPELKKKTQASPLMSVNKYMKGASASAGSSETLTCKKVSKSGSEQKLKSPKEKGTAKCTEKSLNKEQTSKFKGKLVPISLFDSLAVSKVKKSKKIHKQRSMNATFTIKSFKAQKGLIQNPCKLNKKKKVPERSNAPSESKNFDLAEVIFKDKVFRSKENLKLTNGKQDALISSVDKSSRKSRDVHQCSNLIPGKTNLKKDSRAVDIPTSSKKILHEINSSIDKPPSSNNNKVIPLFDFELNASSKIHKTKTSKQNRTVSGSAQTNGTSSNSNSLQNLPAEGKIMKTILGDSRNTKDFPRIVSLSAEKDSQIKKLSNQNNKGCLKGSPETEKKLSPPLNKFFSVLERCTSSTKKSKELKSEKLKSFRDSLSPKNGIKPLTVKKDSTHKPTSNQKKTSFSERTLKAMQTDSKENIASLKTDSSSSEKCHQTKITDFCSKSNISTTVMPLQPSKKYV